jgi:hypothetical protein
MEQRNYTEVKCKNPEAVRAFAMAIIARDSKLNGGSRWKDGDTNVSVTTQNYFPDSEVKEVSIHFPNDVVVARYSSGTDRYSEIHVVEYRKGKSKKVDIEPGYSISLINAYAEDIFWIWDTAKAFFRRLDKTETDEKGKMVINWFNEDVRYTFRFDNADGIRSKVEATKCGSRIDLILFESWNDGDWREISDDYPDYLRRPPSLTEKRVS